MRSFGVMLRNYINYIIIDILANSIQSVTSFVRDLQYVISKPVLTSQINNYLRSQGDRSQANTSYFSILTLNLADRI